MKQTRTDKNRHCLHCLFLLVLLTSLVACGGSSKPIIQGKWEVTLVSRRSGQEGSKIIYEFLPDGTFNAMPPGDTTTVVDKGKYEVLDEGRTVKIQSPLLGGEAVCKFVEDALRCETPEAQIDFKKL